MSVLDPPSRSRPLQAAEIDPAWLESIAGNHVEPVRARKYPYRPGTWKPLTTPRKFVCDLIHEAQKVPLIPMQRRMNLAEVVEARRLATPRIGWCAIFTKAYAIVSAARPELRRAFLDFPWPHLYEHPATLASVAVERDYQGEPGVFFGRVPSPETLRLAEIQALLEYYKNAPAESVGAFRAMNRISALPRPLRRLAWWVGLHFRGFYRASFFGTFGVSVVSAYGASSLFQLSPLTTSLNYGTFAPDGGLDVRLTYDHRVMDGATVARALVHLEQVLNGVIAAELKAIA